ncbi:hypothetical protein FAM18124_01894 [Lacticaseibacillus paracasei]|nr:hypothetical protein FAM18124_01894 [Lacticaseibacillus paracasei]RND69275.1 hypothetical protein FAM18129_01895 [Lacticaseibacillus paracasei]
MDSVVTLVLAEWFSPLRPRPSFKTAGFAGLSRAHHVPAQSPRSQLGLRVFNKPTQEQAAATILLIKIINNNYYYL